jgi:uncharacterized YkwD family protein
MVVQKQRKKEWRNLISKKLTGFLLAASLLASGIPVTAHASIQSTYTKTYAVYTVKSGDTLYKIANKYGTSVSKLKSVNSSVRYTNTIYPGQRLYVSNRNYSSAPAKTPTTTQPNTTVSSVESQVASLVNIERQKAGLAPLKLNVQLSGTARMKSTDMRDKNYFDHQSPTYGSPFDMMQRYGITYRAAGENIAAGQRTAQEVMKGWMTSPGHRQNILNPNFTEIGVGLAEGGSYGYYWTQQFIGK